MPGLNAKKIREMTPGEREKKVEEVQLELSKLRASTLAGAQSKSSKVKELKRTIARIYTIENEEKLLEKEIKNE